MNTKEKGLLLIRKYTKKAENLEQQAKEYKARVLKIFRQLGYCDCDYPYYRIDANGNCTQCGKPSRADIK